MIIKQDSKEPGAYMRRKLRHYQFFNKLYFLPVPGNYLLVGAVDTGTLNGIDREMRIS
jgi:hypothetical protein